jgi:hypothetical protein
MKKLRCSYYRKSHLPDDPGPGVPGSGLVLLDLQEASQSASRDSGVLRALRHLVVVVVAADVIRVPLDRYRHHTGACFFQANL